MRMIRSIRYYARQFGAYHVSTYAASASFFIITAIFPLLMLVLSVISFTPLSTEDFIDTLLRVTPPSFTLLSDGKSADHLCRSAVCLLDHHAVDGFQKYAGAAGWA